MRARKISTVSALALALSLTACSTGSDGDAAAPAPSSSSSTVDADALLVDLGLEGRTGKEIVDALESTTDPRPLALGVSVREDHVLVSDGTAEAAVPLPEDEFYVSVAPFVESTHECYYHSLATCSGELVGEEVSVVITGDDGEVLVDETVTTEANGFTGFWLPRGIEAGTIEVTSEGYEGSVPLATTPGSPTCVTTLQLAPAEA